MWELDCEESWVPKTWCFWTVVLEKTLESPLDCKEIQPVHPKGDQSWVFIGRTDPEAETPVLWPPDAKSWLIWKDPDTGRDLGQEQEGTTEDEMAGWHHWIYGHEFGVNYGSWWWTGRPGMLWFMGSQRVGHDWVTELNWTDFFWTFRWFRIVFLTLELCGNLFYFLKLSGSVPFSHFYLDSSPPSHLYLSYFISIFWAFFLFSQCGALAGQFGEILGPRLLWNEIISCHINKQEKSQPLAFSGVQMWVRALKTTQGDPAEVATLTCPL